MRWWCSWQTNQCFLGHCAASSIISVRALPHIAQTGLICVSSSQSYDSTRFFIFFCLNTSCNVQPLISQGSDQSLRSDKVQSNSDQSSWSFDWRCFKSFKGNNTGTTPRSVVGQMKTGSTCSESHPHLRARWMVWDFANRQMVFEPSSGRVSPVWHLPPTICPLCLICAGTRRCVCWPVALCTLLSPFLFTPVPTVACNYLVSPDQSAIAQITALLFWTSSIGWTKPCHCFLFGSQNTEKLLSTHSLQLQLEMRWQRCVFFFPVWFVVLAAPAFRFHKDPNRRSDQDNHRVFVL